MFNVGDFLVFRRDVCEVLELKAKKYNNVDYYALTPINDKSLKIQVPVNSDKIRPLITKNKVEEIISKISEIKALNINDKLLESEYRNLLSSGKHEDLIQIIKTTYLRNKERLDNNKKIADRDDSFFKLAEKYLYTEFSVILDMSCEEAKKYVTDRTTELDN